VPRVIGGFGTVGGDNRTLGQKAENQRDRPVGRSSTGCSGGWGPVVGPARVTKVLQGLWRVELSVLGKPMKNVMLK